MDHRISAFASAFATTPSGETTLERLIETIRDGTYAEPIRAVRAGEKDKLELPAVTISGTFSVRNSAGIIAHSGLLQVDIDAKDNPGADMRTVQDAMMNCDPHIIATFISAGGRGLKAIIAIDGARHKESAEAAADYFMTMYGVKIDPACKDIPRLCFVSHDPRASLATHDIINLTLSPVSDKSTDVDLSDDKPGDGTPGTPPIGAKEFSYESAEHEMAAVARVDEALSFIPTRPDYPVWLKILSGVFDEIPYHHAIASLNTWSPEETENEYERKYPQRLKDVGFGTVLKMAIEKGFDNSREKRIERAVMKLPDLSGVEVEGDDPPISGSGAPGAPGAPPSSSASSPPPPPRARITRLPDDIIEVRKQPHFVDGVLMPNGFSLWYGRTNVGKSFFVQDLAAAIASGRTWRGAEMVEITGHGPVVYCALEGGFGAEHRILAMKKRGLISDGDPFGLVTIPVRLLEKGVKRGAMVICDAIKEMQDDFGKQVRFVVIDTWARATAGGGEENSNSDALLAVAQCDEVRAAAVNAALGAVHHAGKDESKGSRGASALPDACDTEIEIYKPEGSDISTAIIRKQRDMEFRKPMPFRLDQVVVGADYRGKPVTSCVVVHLKPEEGTVRGAAGGAGTKRGPRIPAHQLLGLLPQASADAWRRECETKFGISRSTFFRYLSEFKEGGRCEVQADGNIILIGDIFGFNGDKDSGNSESH